MSWVKLGGATLGAFDIKQAQTMNKPTIGEYGIVSIRCLTCGPAPLRAVGIRGAFCGARLSGLHFNVFGLDWPFAQSSALGRTNAPDSPGRPGARQAPSPPAGHPPCPFRRVAARAAHLPQTARLAVRPVERPPRWVVHDFARRTDPRRAPDPGPWAVPGGPLDPSRGFRRRRTDRGGCGGLPPRGSRLAICSVERPGPHQCARQPRPPGGPPDPVPAC